MKSQKKISSILLILSAVTSIIYAQDIAVKSDIKAFIDYTPINSYNIDGYTYIKLRSLIISALMFCGMKIAGIAEESGETKKITAIIVGAIFDVIAETLAKGVSLIGFGNFEVRERAAREGKNPQTGEKIKIEACKVPAFKAGKSLKDIVK